MAAAAGTFVDRGALMVYSAYHWRHKGMIRFNEFRGLIRPQKQSVSSVKDGWIELFEKKYFEGRYLTIRGAEGIDIADFGDVRAQGSGFDNKIRSVRFQLPDGVKYRLFRNKKFKGKIIDLVGTGAVSEIADIKEMVRGANVSSASIQS